MKTLLAALAFTTAFTVPELALARSVTLTTEMNAYGGRAAFLAYYLTDATGAYAGSVWMAGGKTKYYQHLSGWFAATGGDAGQVDGITGASIGSGQSVTITLDLEDALFDAGYTLHVDAAVEEMRDSPSDVSVPLTAAGAGTVAAGRRYIAAFNYSF